MIVVTTTKNIVSCGLIVKGPPHWIMNKHPAITGDINDCKGNKQSKQWVVTVMITMV